MATHRPWRWTTLAITTLTALALAALPLALYEHAPGARAHLATEAKLSASVLSITGFSYSPNPISVNSQVQVSIQISGGTPPYLAWLNGTPPGCAPTSIPYSTSQTSNMFSCTPTSTGSYSIHLDIVDSATPTAGHASSSAMLVVNGNNGHNGNGGGGNGNGSNASGSKGGFSLPGGLVSLLSLFVIVFLAAFVALAAGVIATAVAVSRGLKRLNKTMAETRGSSNTVGTQAASATGPK